MTQRDIELVKEFGPKFVDRGGDILSDMLYLAANAYSVMTDAEWKDCAEAMERFAFELAKARELVFTRMEKAGVEY